MNYPQGRKRKLSSPEDVTWFPRTYVKTDAKGTRRRMISGVCEECGETLETTWANFSRGNRHPYRFRHLKCAQDAWNREQAETRSAVSVADVATKIYRKYQHGAKARGYAFELTPSEFLSLCTSDCTYCGRPPQPHYRWSNVALGGVDRIDNDKGYTSDNSCACCTVCNFIKKDTAISVWQDFLGRVRAWRG